MKKNQPGQVMGLQVTALDGNPFTGVMTIYITLDGGTQAQGTVGSGIMTHRGNGYHVYLPSKAETNGNLVAWTGVGVNAMNAGGQFYTTWPQSGDIYTRLAALWMRLRGR